MHHLSLWLRGQGQNVRIGDRIITLLYEGGKTELKLWGKSSIRCLPASILLFLSFPSNVAQTLTPYENSTNPFIFRIMVYLLNIPLYLLTLSNIYIYIFLPSFWWTFFHLPFLSLPPPSPSYSPLPRLNYFFSEFL